jgi:hypothetical protein
MYTVQYLFVPTVQTYPRLWVLNDLWRTRLSRRRMILFLSYPLSRQLAGPTTHRKTEKERKLANGRGGDGGGDKIEKAWSSIIIQYSVPLSVHTLVSSPARVNMVFFIILDFMARFLSLFKSFLWPPACLLPPFPFRCGVLILSKNEKNS